MSYAFFWVKTEVIIFFLPSLTKERIDASKKVISQLQKERKELTQKIRLEQLLQKQRLEKQHSKWINLFLVAYNFQDGYQQSGKIKESRINAY